MYKGIIFDIDGTILDTRQVILQTLQRVVVEETGKWYTFQELSFAMKETSPATLTRLQLPDIDTALKKWVEYIKKEIPMIRPFEGIVSVLDSLHNLDLPLGIVTSKTREELTTDFLALGLSRYFQVILTADDVQETKPSPEPLLKCTEYLKIKPDETLYIGDTSFDAEAASRARMDFALALWGSLDSTLKAAHYLTHPKEILGLLLG